MLGPDARVDVADDHVRAGIRRSAERGPHVRRADERRVVVERLVQGVLLDRVDAGDGEDLTDLVGRHPGGDAAVGRDELGADPRGRHGALDRGGDRVRDLVRVPARRRSPQPRSASATCPSPRGSSRAKPSTPPLYDAVASKSYLIITFTGAESVSPRSDGSVLAYAAESDLPALNVESGVSAVAVSVVFDDVAPPAATPSAPTSTAPSKSKPSLRDNLIQTPLSGARTD